MPSGYCPDAPSAGGSGLPRKNPYGGWSCALSRGEAGRAWLCRLKSRTAALHGRGCGLAGSRGIPSEMLLMIPASRRAPRWRALRKASA